MSNVALLIRQDARAITRAVSSPAAPRRAELPSATRRRCQRLASLIAGQEYPQSIPPSLFRVALAYQRVAIGFDE
ncbi:hypothetical protein EVAR_49898_1 [Eumeta japonica]|uniref:Uncharacterized protein n=1 Tax=Eumeta variegata TaxID=151549 RepID=A0A4C1Y192_EUMVA|nr:hypothetical protein EVAR_49898_1 [Eumeta japonica]